MSGQVRGDHAVIFYQDDHELCASIVQFVLDGLRNGERTIILATRPHWNDVRAALASATDDTEIAHVTFIDADDVLRDIVVGDSIDTHHFQALLQQVMAGADGPVRFFGELVTLLAARGALSHALELEKIGHQLSSAAGIPILCAYHLHHLEPSGQHVQQVADAHHRAIPEGPKGDSGGRVVLLADDYEDTRDLYAEYFQANGYRVLTAQNGYEAIRAARTWRPDVILLDIRMPDISGIDAMKVLKQDQRLAGVPIVAFTANARDSARVECLAAGFDAVIVKPCLPDSLLKQVALLCAAAA